MNIFGADFCTTLGDIAQTDAELILQQLSSRQTIERMHVQSGYANEEAGTTKLFLLVVVAQDVANILTQKTFDAFAKLLHAIDVSLIHLPFNIRARAEWRNLSVDFVVPGYVSYQISDDRKTFHRLDSNGFIQGQSIQASGRGKRELLVPTRVLHVTRGRPLTSAEHEPHWPALQFHRTARSGARCP